MIQIVNGHESSSFTIGSSNSDHGSNENEHHQAFYCNEKGSLLTDRILATCILTLFFFIGTAGNLLFICIYLYKQRRRSYFVRTRLIRSNCIRFKSQVNNKAIFTLSISNLLLSSVFIPYTIIFRVWNQKANPVVVKCVEHFKDTFIYANILLILLLSIERYVAVCKPHFYKKLESNVDRIIWVVFLLAISLASTNYFVTVKIKQECEDNGNSSGYVQEPVMASNGAGASNNNPGDDYNPFLYASVNGRRRSVNINFLISAVIVSVSGVGSTFFYIQIARHHLGVMRKNKNLKLREHLAGDDQDNGAPDALKEEEEEARRDKEFLSVARRSTKSFSFSSTTTTGMTSTIIEMNSVGQQFKYSISGAGGNPSVGGGGGGGGGEKSRKSSERTPPTSGPGDDANKNGDSDKQHKLDASVQTDLIVNLRKLVKKRNSNIFASNLITKISIWLSVIIWMSILPFLLSVLRIIPYYKFIYFLYFTESVFSPVVYVCLNKRYRNYLKKFLRLNF